ncbi:MAG: MCE family protein [Calditrichaeota bacterium]|nr:MAG: MCE family protein [Calditrichota bacterium]
MNYKRMSFISGLVIFFGIVVLMITIITLSSKHIFFTNDYVLYVKFKDVTGLQDQSKVFMRGYRIGWTKEVQFLEDGVIVRIDIKKKYQIPDDSRFEVNTVSLLGEKAITITPGKSKTYLKPRTIVSGHNEDIMNKVKAILDQVNGSLEKGNLDQKVTQLSQTLETFHSILQKLDKKVAQLQLEDYNKSIRQMGDAGTVAKKVLTQTSDSLQITLNKFNHTMDSLGKLSSELHQIAQKINKGEGSAGKFVNDEKYIENLNTTLQELNTLLADLKKNPKKYINLSIF